MEDNPAPKSMGSLIQISSIYIDLKIPKEKNETDSCPHNFSIRGYAAEMRKKNPKVSMPFALSGGNLKDSVAKLPPMEVPKVRSSNCPDCQWRNINNSATEEITVHSSCSTSLNVSNGDTDMVLSGTQQDPTAERNQNSICDGTGDAASTDINTGPVEPASDKSVNIGVEEPATQTGNIIISDDCSDGSLKRMEVSIPAAANPIEVAPFQAEESGVASSESDQKKKHDNPSGASRRKRKLRYLTDLLGDKGNIISDRPRQDDSSVHNIAVPSGSGIVVSQDQAPHAEVGKGSKSPQKADSERTVTDVAISSSERQANASSGTKNDCAKRKTERIPAPVKRKNKQIQVQDRVSPRLGEQSFSKINVKESDQHAATANTLSRSLGTSSANGKQDNHSRNSQSPQVPEREQSNVTQTSSQISKYLPSELKEGLDLSLNSFPEKIDSSSNKEKPSSSESVLEKDDLPLGESSILPASLPDLRKNSQLLDLNQNSVVLEKRILQKEMMMSCQKDKTSEVQACLKEINKQSDQMASNRISQGSSDDIPMEIVELMARNQYERGLADKGSQSFRPGINNIVGRFPEVQGMGTMPQFVKGIPGLTNYSPANARSGMSIVVANAGAVKGNPMNYAQMNQNSLQNTHPAQNTISFYNLAPQNQHVFSRRMQYTSSASASSGSQHNERAEILPSSKALNISFGLGMQQKYPTQNPELQHRGKTISDIKADELRKTQEAHTILSKPGSSELIIKPKGPVDPYANESIPAMQLLSLMDGRSQGKTFNMGSSKPFGPCSYHPRYGTSERKDFINGSLFQRQNRLAASVGETSEQSMGRHPFAFSGQPQERDQSYLARYTGCIPYTGQTSDQGKDKQKAIVVAKSTTPYSQRYRGRRSLSQNGLTIAQQVHSLSIMPRGLNCVTNLNPAEYFLPDDEENDFTIWGEKLKIPKRKYSREITSDGGKRQRTTKPKAGREQPENPSS